MSSFRLYFMLINLSVKAKMQYKADFFIGIISILLMNFTNFSLIGIMVYRFHNLNGWTIWELLFSYSIWVMGRSIYGIFFRQFSDFEDEIVQGTFDSYLLRPVSPFLQYAGKEVNYIGFGDVIIGVSGLIIVFGKLKLTWGIKQWIFFFICVLSSFCIHLSINWIGASVCFWTVRSQNLIAIIDNFSFLCQKYPVDMFGITFKIIVTIIIPVAYLNYYPSVVLLGKKVPSGFYIYLTPFIASVMLILGAILWCNGIKRYESTGS